MPNLHTQLPLERVADTPAQAVGPVGLADGLGAASIALGTPLLLFPGHTLEATGIEPDARAKWLARFVGLREFSAAGTILAMRHRRIGAWSRVAGDTMDILMVARSWRRRRDTTRLLGTLGALAGIFAADLYTAVTLDRAEGTHVEDGSESHGIGMSPAEAELGSRQRTAATVLRPEDEVRAAFAQFSWRGLEPLAAESEGQVRFVPAPGGRGTEVHLRHAGDVRVSDDLRRFKALLETGVEIRSDKTPEGFSSLRQVMQRPGHPQEVGA